MRESVIKEELLNRVKAIKLIQTDFSVDGISFDAPVIDGIRVFGEFDALANIFNAEVYDTIIRDRECRAFDLDGVEVYNV